MVSVFGDIIPLDLLSALKLTTTPTYLTNYISQIYVKNGVISVKIKNEETGLVIGGFTANIVKDFQSETLQSSVPHVAGTILFGRKDSIVNLDAVYDLTAQTGAIESSCVFIHEPSMLSGFEVQHTRVSGDVVFDFSSPNSNMVATVLGQTITLGVIDKEKVLSKQDKASSNNTCGRDFIFKINTVEPDDNGVIRIVGVSPITIDTSVQGTLLHTNKEICPRNENIPPFYRNNFYFNTDEPLYAENEYIGANFVGADRVKKDILNTTALEWPSWPPPEERYSK